jgi:hypothetical protein
MEPAMKTVIDFLFKDKHNLRKMSFAELGFIGITWSVVSILIFAALTAVL